MSKLLLIGLLLSAGCAHNARNPAPVVAPFPTRVENTGSMRPTLKGGELLNVVSWPWILLKVGDVVVYSDRILHILVIHRVHAIGINSKGERFLICKGDSNPLPDTYIVLERDYVGFIPNL